MTLADALTPGQARALALAARHVNASTRDAISEVALLGALQSGQVPTRYQHHLFAFFDETDTATMADLVVSRAVTFSQLAAIADKLLLVGHDTRTWLDDCRSI